MPPHKLYSLCAGMIGSRGEIGYFFHTAYRPGVSIKSNSDKGELNRTVTWQDIAVDSVMEGYLHAAEPEGRSAPVRFLSAILETCLSQHTLNIPHHILRFLSGIIPCAKAGAL